MAANDISVTIKLPPRAHQRLHEMAKAKGYPIATYAQLLFDAAFSARVGQERGQPASDAEMDELVKAVFCLAGQVNVKAIAKATGVPEKTVQRILDGWRQHRRAA
jgi:hypothetical protein